MRSPAEQVAMNCRAHHIGKRLTCTRLAGHAGRHRAILPNGTPWEWVIGITLPAVDIDDADLTKEEAVQHYGKLCAECGLMHRGDCG